jgi:hypothetical protein
MPVLKKLTLSLIFITLLFTSFSQVNLNQGLMAYYPFTGNANDASGNNNNPVFNNAVLTADRSGNTNNAYHFNGSSSYMQIPNSASLNITGNIMSIAAWVKPTGYYTGLCYNNILLTKATLDNGSPNYSMRFTDPVNGCTAAANTAQEMFYGPDGVVASTPFVQLNRWYSVIWTSDGTTTKIYVDCVLKATGSAAGLNFSNSNDLFFGHMNNATFPYWLNGDLDEIRIYNRALTTDEVNTLGGCAVTNTVCKPTFQKKYGGNKDEFSYDIIPNADGTFMSVGYTRSFGSGSYDGLLQKIDKNGDLLWSKTFGGAGQDVFFSGKATSDGGYIMGGNTASFGGAASGVTWIVKTDGNGTLQWSRKYDDGSSEGSTAWEVITTSDGGYAITGTSRFAPGTADVMVVKTDNVGSVQWAKSYNSGNTDQSLGILEDADSLVVVANQYGQSSSLYDGVIMKLNRANGNVAWARNYDVENKLNWPRGLSKTSTGYGLIFYQDVVFSPTNMEEVVMRTDRNGSPIVLLKIKDATAYRNQQGYTPTKDDGFIISETDNLSTAATLVKVSSTGVVEWTKKFGGGGGQNLHTVKQAIDGGYILSGSKTSTPSNVDSNDVYFVKTDSLGNTAGCTVGTGSTIISSPTYTYNPSFVWAFVTPLSFGTTSITVFETTVAPATTTLCASCLSQVTDTIINAYTAVSSFDICKNAVTVDDASKYKVGDTVLVIQMKGAVIDSTNTAAFGTITNYKNAGNYEFNYIKSKNGNIVELKNVLTRQYDFTDGKVQLVRVPFFQKLNLPNTITCQPWNGSSGGIVVFNVADTLSLAADIDVSGKGFRGTVIDNHISSCHEAQYFYNASSTNAGFKGEGIFNLSANYARGRGKAANAGGGGNGANAGGGGGANFGGGGLGGREFLCSATPQIDNGGIGGLAVTYNNTANKIFLGGAGGTGDENDFTGSTGGNGGGIILINAGAIRSNAFKISSKGITPAACSGPNCGDGQGGGGAGGTVILNSSNFIDNTTVNTSGGDGGSYTNTNPLGYHGPGGGGGGGALWLKSASLPANVTHTSIVGANGTWLSTGQTGGALSGTAGGTVFNVAVPVASVAYKATFDSAKFNVIVTTCTSFKFDGMANIDNSKVVKWRWSFGDGYIDSTQAVSHNYLAPGTYPVKVIATDIYGCVATFYVDLTVFCRCEAIKVTTPNPARNSVSISGLGCGINTILMYNMLGQKVRQVVSDKAVETIDVTTLARGMYIIKVINSKGTATPLKIEKM